MKPKNYSSKKIPIRKMHWFSAKSRSIRIRKTLPNLPYRLWNHLQNTSVFFRRRKALRALPTFRLERIIANRSRWLRQNNPHDAIPPFPPQSPQIPSEINPRYFLRISRSWLFHHQQILKSPFPTLSRSNGATHPMPRWPRLGIHHQTLWEWNQHHSRNPPQ